MKNNILIRKSRFPLYRSRLWIVICPSLIKAIDHVEDLISSKIYPAGPKLSIDSYTYAEINDRGAKGFYIFLKPNTRPGVIAHEVKHTINTLFAWHGLKLSLNNDESECYYLEYVVDQVHNTIKQYNKLYPTPLRIRKNTETLIETKD